jgi:hypothetical protein
MVLVEAVILLPIDRRLELTSRPRVPHTDSHR